MSEPVRRVEGFGTGRLDRDMFTQFSRLLLRVRALPDHAGW